MIGKWLRSVIETCSQNMGIYNICKQDSCLTKKKKLKVHVKCLSLHSNNIRVRILQKYKQITKNDNSVDFKVITCIFFLKYFVLYM